MTRLTLDIIKSYKFEQKTFKPDWDDVQVDYTLPNGITLGTLTVCNNEPCNVDIYKELSDKNEDFNIDEY